MESKFNLNDKLISLVEDGLSIEEAASVLNLDLDQAKLVILNSSSSKKKSNGEAEDPDELIAANKPKAIRMLIRIGLDNSIENISARVAALRTIVEHKSIAEGAENDKVMAMYKKMTEVSERYEKELSSISSKEKNDQTTVVIPNTSSETLSNVVQSANFIQKFEEKKNSQKSSKEKETTLDYAV